MAIVMLSFSIHGIYFNQVKLVICWQITNGMVLECTNQKKTSEKTTTTKNKWSRKPCEWTEKCGHRQDVAHKLFL